VFKRIENRSVSSRQRVFLLSTPFTNGMPSKEAFMKRTIGFVMVVTLMLVSGCNTIRGAGEDLQQGGEAIQRAAS
jgi:predicted small secreted protein